MNGNVPDDGKRVWAYALPVCPVHECKTLWGAGWCSECEGYWTEIVEVQDSVNNVRTATHNGERL